MSESGFENDQVGDEKESVEFEGDGLLTHPSTDFNAPVEDGLVQPPSAPTQPWYTSPTQISSMLSQFTTQYNIANMSLVLPILHQISIVHMMEEQEEGMTSADGMTNLTTRPEMTTKIQSMAATAVMMGMILGQLAAGALGDTWLGLVGALRLVIIIQILASLASAACAGPTLYVQLISWRFVLGLGAGGVYPLAAILSAKQAEAPSTSSATKNSAAIQRVVLTFSMQGVGFVTVPLVTLLLLYTVRDLDLIWRILLALGSLPGMILLYLQWRVHRHHVAGQDRQLVSQQSNDMDENNQVGVDDHEFRNFRVPPLRLPVPGMTRFDTASEGDNASVLDSVAGETMEDGGDGAVAHTMEMLERTSWWEAVRTETDLFRKLMATAMTWFLFDILFFGNTLFKEAVIDAAFGAKHQTDPRAMLKSTAFDSLMLTLISLPGYALAALFLGKTVCFVPQTLRFVTLQGFAGMGIFYLVIGVYWKELQKFPTLLVILYGMSFFFANYGPNTTTFVLPSVTYSPGCRATFNGVSAAAAKVGAAVGTFLFAPAADRFGDATLMVVCSVIAAVSLLVTARYVHEGEDRSLNRHE